MVSTAKYTAYLKSLFIQYKTYFFSLGLVAIIASLFGIAVDYKVKEIIDAIQSNPKSNIALLLSLFIFYKFMHHGMFFIARLLHIRYQPLLVVQTVADLYTKILKHSLYWFDSHMAGEISNKIADFQTSITNVILNSFRSLHHVATVIISIFFLLRINVLSAIIIVAFVLIYTPVIVFLLRRQMELEEKRVMARQETLGIINDSIANMFGIKVIGNVWTEFKSKIKPPLDYWAEWDKQTRKFDAYFVDNADTIMVTFMGAAQMCLLTHLYQTQQITAGDFAFISTITLNIRIELDNFLEKLLFTINPSIASIKASLAFINSQYDTQDKPDAKVLTNVQGDIVFKDVCFAYNDSTTDVLSMMNLHIKAGQKVGIVGTSGAGKTTIMRCLLRYFDLRSGQILIDGQNIADVTQESLRAHISVIPQDVTMFHRSVLENLQIANSDAHFDDIVKVCKRARIHYDIINMPHGYDSIVGERGIKMSGGQRQRLAIARALLKNAPILILDEATSALDTPTEHLIQRSLNEILETSNVTALVIAHRLSTLLHMDRILVLDRGTIIEDGTHQELLARGGLYKTLWDAQVNGFLPHTNKSSEEDDE